MQECGSIGLIGYGSQGKAWAANLRDTGFLVEVYLADTSRSHQVAWRDGFITSTPTDRQWQAPYYALLIPDHLHDTFLARFQNRLPSGATLIFAHGFSSVFNSIRLRKDLDLILISPKVIGPKLRQRFLGKLPNTFGIAVRQDYTGAAWQTAERLAAAVGGANVELIKTTFKEECLINLFTEQILLCGGLPGLIDATYQFMVSKGLNAKLAYQECFHETAYMMDLISQVGTQGLAERISPIARLGGARAKKFLLDGDFQKKLELLYNDIVSGKFAESISVSDLVPHNPTLTSGEAQI